eukprot:GFYU01013047.1.p1 GENE.GFYU01013047.1~~GFYU01013047.1.p1  ORF type:complete len:333 (+),score=77.05 GFYU01013047.1:456-1454(+)
MKFGTYLDKLAEGKADNYYLAVQNVKTVFPVLSPDLECVPYIPVMHRGPYVWIAPKGHYEFCHYDPDDNFLAVLHGIKKLRMFSNKYLHNMYPNPLGRKGYTIQTQIDLEAPDLDEFPMFNDDVVEWTCELLSGDMLYIPVFTWHQVCSPEETISITHFYGSTGNYLDRLHSDADTWESFLYFFRNILEQNRFAIEPLSARWSESQVCTALDDFFYKQYKTTPTPEQSHMLVQEIESYFNEKCAEADVIVRKYSGPNAPDAISSLPDASSSMHTDPYQEGRRGSSDDDNTCSDSTNHTNGDSHSSHSHSVGGAAETEKPRKLKLKVRGLLHR